MTCQPLSYGSSRVFIEDSENVTNGGSEFEHVLIYNSDRISCKSDHFWNAYIEKSIIDETLSDHRF